MSYYMLSKYNSACNSKSSMKVLVIVTTTTIIVTTVTNSFIPQISMVSADANVI